MAQQTAVNWLLSELQIRLLKIKSEPDGIVRERMINSFLIDAEQAEAMEKEQTVEAWNDGNFLGRNGNILADYSDGKGYYKSEFENK